LGGRKGLGKKTEWWGAGVAICLERDADLHMAQLMPLPLTVSCFSKIQTGFTFLVPTHPGSPGKRAVKRVCVCVGGSSFSVRVVVCVVNVTACVCAGQLMVDGMSSTSSRRWQHDISALSSVYSLHAWRPVAVATACTHAPRSLRRCVACNGLLAAKRRPLMV